MLSKLLKHEFRATGRTMLPVYAAVVVLAGCRGLALDGPSRAAGAHAPVVQVAAVGASALDDEVGDDAVEPQPIVKP